MRARAGPVTVVRPRWWRRSGAAVGLLLVVSAVSSHLGEASGWWTLFASVAGLVMLVDGLFEGVEVGEHGIRTRRFLRRWRSARWSEIAGFEAGWAPAALLTDGRRLRLLDWAGDGHRVVERLAAEQRRHRRGARIDPTGRGRPDA